MFAILDTFVSSRPWRLAHAWCPLLFGCIYVIFNVLYVVTFEGTDIFGHDWVYPVLKWNEEPAQSGGFVAVSIAVILLCHIIFWGLTKFRDRIWSSKFFDPKSEVEDGVPKQTGFDSRMTGVKTISVTVTPT